jgi:lactate dehydrogenase-like 2-hydroxyacid dehydrogenase
MVVDGMGGRIGQEVVQRLRAAFGEHVEILAVGTNSTATTAMLKAGANRGATGENAVRVTAREADILIGPLSALIPDSMMGEVTPGMAEALALSGARKVM